MAGGLTMARSRFASHLRKAGKTTISVAPPEPAVSAPAWPHAAGAKSPEEPILKRGTVLGDEGTSRLGSKGISSHR